MNRAFSGLRIVDATHVLAGPFAAYQLGVLGAEVIKVEAPLDPDQARMQGSDRKLSDANMGLAFMAQGFEQEGGCHRPEDGGRARGDAPVARDG